MGMVASLVMGPISVVYILFPMLPSQELEVWFLSHVWCAALMGQYAIFSKWLPKVVVVLLFYIHSKHLRSCRDGQLT